MLTRRQPLQSRRELLVDRYVIHSLTGAELRLAQPIDAGKFRLYYRGVPNAGADESWSFASTAETCIAVLECPLFPATATSRPRRDAIHTPVNHTR